MAESCKNIVKKKVSHKPETKSSKLNNNVAYFTLNPNVRFQDSYRQPVKCTQGKMGWVLKLAQLKKWSRDKEHKPPPPVSVINW